MSKQEDKISESVLSTPLSILSGSGEPICSLATQPGGAIGVIRVSGEKAIEITDKVFHGVRGKHLSDAKGNTLHYGEILDKEEIPLMMFWLVSSVLLIVIRVRIVRRYLVMVLLIFLIRL